MVEEFAITILAQADGGTRVAVAGELDLYRVPELADALGAPADGPIVVDLQQVTFLDSAVLGLLVKLHRQRQAAGDALVVVIGEQTPKNVFALTGLDRILTIRSAEPAPEPSSS